MILPYLLNSNALATDTSHWTPKSTRRQNRENGHTHTHTHTQDNYCNPRCACTPRVNNKHIFFKYLPPSHQPSSKYACVHYATMCLICYQTNNRRMQVLMGTVYCQHLPQIIGSTVVHAMDDVLLLGSLRTRNET